MRARFLFILAKWFRLQILLVVFSLLCSNASFSQPITWLGSGVDTFASNPASWEGGVLPTASSDIIIPDGSVQMHVNANTTWTSITFNGGGAPSGMSIATGITLTVTGNITIQAATASRVIFNLGNLTSVAILGGTNTGLLGNRLHLAASATLTVSGNVTEGDLVMRDNTIATFGGNVTGGSLDVQSGNSSTINFNSTDPQTVPAGVYANIVFSGGGAKTVTGAISVSTNVNFVNGIVINSSPIFLDGSLGGQPTSSGGGVLSFANGPLRRFVPGFAGRLTFPVGKQGAGFHPVFITTAAVGGDFTAEYIRSSGRALGSITAPGIVAVSNCEYWTVTRTAGGTADVELTWDPTSGCGGTYIANLPSLRVVHFNGTNWDQSGGTGGSGTTASGNVSWPGVTTFSPFTIGTTSTLNPLPVALTEFSVSRCGNNICLYWNTISEDNNDYFDIERSGDGRQFNSIDRVNGNGTTSDPHNYTSRDDQPLDGANYYRIKQVNLDGKHSYSSVIRINNAPVSSFSASITPNPAGSVMNLVIEGVKEKENLLFEVMNTNGMIVYRESISAGGTTMVKNLRRPALSAGLYFYRITRSANNETLSGRLILE